MRKWRRVNLSELINGANAIEIYEMNGPEPGIVSKMKTLRFCTADLAHPGFSYPNVVSLDGNNRSFVKTVFIEVIDFRLLKKMLRCRKICNISVFCDNNVFGRCNLIADQWQLSKDANGGIIIGQRDNGEHGLPLNQYVPANGEVGIAGDLIESHPYYCDQTPAYRKVDCYTVDQPCIFDKTVYNTNFRSRALVLQLIIPPSSVAGIKPGILLHWGAEVW